MVWQSSHPARQAGGSRQAISQADLGACRSDGGSAEKLTGVKPGRELARKPPANWGAAKSKSRFEEQGMWWALGTGRMADDSKGVGGHREGGQEAQASVEDEGTG